MKRIIKNTLGRCVVSLAHKLPQSRSFLKALGLRTSQGVFEDRIVSIPLKGSRPLRLTHVDESYLAFQLFWRGSDYYEPITRQLLQILVQPRDTFLDLGAHIGFFSLSVGLSVPGVQVIAFEPNPKNFRILEANATANGMTDIVCESSAISESDGSATLYLTDSDMSASLMKDFQAEDTKQISSIEVRTTSLDSYLRRQRIGSRMIIKVDIEGHEPAFFRGALQTIEVHKPDIVLEVLYDQDPAIVSWLKLLGYHFYPITDGVLVELDAPRLVKRFPFLFLNHLLSVRPKQELIAIFDRVAAATGNLNLLETSKHFPKEEWPLLWQEESEPENSSASTGICGPYR
jgi:FkbM family methyltransferase